MIGNCRSARRLQSVAPVRRASATSVPSAAGVRRGSSSVFDGRLPSNTRCGTNAAGVPSAATSAAVLPNFTDRSQVNLKVSPSRFHSELTWMGS